MAFPVDLLNNCSHEELESSAEEYLTELRCGDPENPEYFTCLNNQIPISLSTVGFIPLYGGDQTHKILALFAPEDSLTAVALCASYLTQSYQLPVLDTMYIRKSHQGKDLGLLMLEDFVDSFTEDTLGLRFPLSSFMYTACKQYFEKYPDHDLLWEIEGTGHWHQRIPITSALQREIFRHAEVPQSEVRKLTYEDCDSISASENETGCGENKPSEMQVDPVRGRGVLDTYASTSEGLDKTPVNIQIRSSLLKRPKIGKRFHDSDINPLQDVDENTPQASSVAPTNRLESTAYTSESSEDLVEDEPNESMVDSEQETKDKEQHILETQGLSQSVPQKQDDEEKSELEPLNGEVMEDTLKTSLKTEEDTDHDALDEKSKQQFDHSSEESGTLPIPPAVESTKSPEDVAPDKTEDVID
ncbi:soluble lamin-associated protein of 75 kDa-like, partial [Gracilinanus agilis]|uniref:soluble lamin-associated protein of 75 kDa-like n=1 Tax=Gracilinanus agilis TaxID=191870 RepID=UPI001CFE28A2